MQNAQLADELKSTLDIRPFPDVISWSWGFGLSDYSLALDATLAKYAAMGVTVIVASGDTGVGSALVGIVWSVVWTVYSRDEKGSEDT